MAERTGCPVLLNLWSYVMCYMKKYFILFLKRTIQKARKGWSEGSGSSFLELIKEVQGRLRSRLVIMMKRKEHPKSTQITHLVRREDPDVALSMMNTQAYNVILKFTYNESA